MNHSPASLPPVAEGRISSLQKMDWRHDDRPRCPGWECDVVEMLGDAMRFDGGGDGRAGFGFADRLAAAVNQREALYDSLDAFQHSSKECH